MKAKTTTTQIGEESYAVFTNPSSSSWQIFLRRDGNEDACLPVFLTSWDEQRQQRYEKFLLFPTPGSGEEPLIQIILYPPEETTRGDGAWPDMIVHCRVPMTIQRESQTRRIFMTFLCRLETHPETHHLTVHLPERSDITFVQKEGARSKRDPSMSFLPAMERLEHELLSWATKLDDTVYLYRIAAKMFLGLQALREWQFKRAEAHFREAATFDHPDESEAYFYLALSCLWQQKPRDACGYFHEDGVDRAVRLPCFFALWSTLCQYDSYAAYLTALKRRYADQLVRYDDDEFEERPKQRKKTPEEKKRRETQILLEIDEGHHQPEIFDEEETYSGGNRLLMAVFCFLQQDYRGCLKYLQGLSSSSFVGYAPLWAVNYWKGLANLELGRYEVAERLLRRALLPISPLESVPPILIRPLLWSQERHRSFFNEHFRLLLAQKGVNCN